MEEALFTLGPHGKRALELEGRKIGRLETTPPTQLEHFSAINDIRIAAELAGGLAYFFACWEFAGLKWVEPIIPDALFSLGGQTIALEYDNGTESLRYLVRSKMEIYRREIGSCPVDRVLVVFDRQSRMANLVEAMGSRTLHRVVLTTLDHILKAGLHHVFLDAENVHLH